MLDQHRNPRYWTEVLPGNWQFHGWGHGEQGHVALPKETDIDFAATDSLECSQDQAYVVIGKGFP